MMFFGCSSADDSDDSSSGNNESEKPNGEFYYDSASGKYKGHFTWTATKAMHQVLIDEGHFGGFFVKLVAPAGSDCFAGGSGFAIESNELIVYHSWTDVGYSPNKGSYSTNGYVVTGNVYDLTDGNINMVNQFRGRSDIEVQVHLLWKNVPNGLNVPSEIAFRQQGYYSR